MSVNRDGHTLTILTTGQVLVAGGCDGGWGFCTLLASAELYDPGQGTWSPAGAMSTARGSATATLLANGQVLVAGGSDASGANLASAELFVPATTARLAITPAQGTVGTPVTMTGGKFGGNEIVNIYADTTASHPVYAAFTDSAGNFRIHRRAVPEPYGSHTLIAVGQTSGVTATTSFLEQTSMMLQPRAGDPGQTIGVTGYALGASEAVSLRWDTPTGLVLREDGTDSRGTMYSFFVVPKGAEPGQHLVYGTGKRTHAQAIVVFTVR
jgi:hypothetical protein